MEYFSYRFWVLMYAVAFSIIYIAFNFSTLVMYARRSLEQLFAGFISGFLILMPLLSIFKVTMGHSEKPFVCIIRLSTKRVY